MTRYWVIAPYNAERIEIWETVWQYDLANNTIAIGWNQLGDISRYNEQQLKGAIEDTYADKLPASKTNLFNTMWRFYNEIAKGDIVIARRGLKQIAAVGTVMQTAYYDPEKGRERVGEATDHFYANFIGVQWHDQPRDYQFGNIVFSMQTMYEISEEKYNDLKPPNGTDEQAEFILEKYLEEFIVSNFDRIFKGRLAPFTDDKGGPQQYSTEIGNIDILAREPNTDSFVVIELKKGRPSDKVIGQILRYMGWVKENLCTGNQQVKGIIICKEADAKLEYALKMMNNIELKRYRVDFELI